MYSRHSHTRMGEMSVCVLDMLTPTWEGRPCIRWARSHRRGRDGCVYSGLVHTDLGGTAVHTVGTLTPMWETWIILQLTLQCGTLHTMGVPSFLLNE